MNDSRVLKLSERPLEPDAPRVTASPSVNVLLMLRDHLPREYAAAMAEIAAIDKRRAELVITTAQLADHARIAGIDL